MKVVLLLVMLNGVFSFSQNQENEKILRIPIVFHIIHETKTNIDYPDSVFHNLIEKVNIGFNRVKIPDIDPLYQKDVATCNIQFYVPSFQNCGNLKAISWNKTTKKSFDAVYGDKSIKTKENGLIDVNKVLNIWFFAFADPPNVLSGRAVKTGKYSGVSLAMRTLDNGEAPFLLTHEIGHYLNLKHIWGTFEDSAGISCALDYEGDLVKDTPLQKSRNTYEAITIDKDTIKVCFKPKTVSNYENFMDYAYQETSMFTKDQKERMRSYILKHRSKLIKPFECSGTLVNNQSVLSKVKQRDKFGTRMMVDSRFPYGTISDRDMIELFAVNGIPPSVDNLKRIGLEIIANDKFRDIITGKTVNQDYIFKYLDIDIAKKRFAQSSNNLKEDKPKKVKGNPIIFVNPNYYKRKVVLTNLANRKEYEIDINKSGYNYGDKEIHIELIPFGTYKCDIYTVFTRKKIRSFTIDFNSNNQKINLIKNGYN